MHGQKINIVFDIDDTMYDLMGPFKNAHRKFFASKTNADSTELFMKSRIYSDFILEQEKEGNICKEDTFYERLRMTYQDVGFKIHREESDRFEAEYRHNQTIIQMFDFMRDILDYCNAEQIPTAVLTNGNHEGQWRKANALDLLKWFTPEQIFISGDIGYQKPDVRAFKVIEEQMNFLPEHTWYIGDTYESDIVSAAQAGWHTIWLNHRRRACPAQINMADYELRCGDDLLPLMRFLSAH